MLGSQGDRCTFWGTGIRDSPIAPITNYYQLPITHYPLPICTSLILELLYIALLRKVRYALCPMPYALCPMPYALCPMPYAHEYLIFLRIAR